MQDMILTITITIQIPVPPMPPAPADTKKPEQVFTKEQPPVCRCLALDDGEECVCVQSISYSLLCRWFRAAVLPLDKELEAALFHRLDRKRCCVCNSYFLPGSNRAKYCPDCAGRMKRIKAAERKRKQRAKCHALGAEKAL